MEVSQRWRNTRSYIAVRAIFRTIPRPLRSAVLEGIGAAPRIAKSALARLRHLQRTAASVVGKFRCSVCGRHVDRFDPIPTTYLEEPIRYGFKYTIDEAEMCNAEGYLCPWCGASDRERLYALYLIDYFSKPASPNPMKMVDFAPSAQLSEFIRQRIASSQSGIEYRTADLFRDDVDDRVDITDMTLYEDNSVDFFICSHVLEHVTDDRKAMRELYRILKRNGRGILVVPIVLTASEIDEDPSVTDPAERWRRFGQDDHVRLYSKTGFLSRVEQAGFQIDQLDSSHFGAGTFRRHGITEQSVLYIVSKHDEEH